MVLEPDVVDVVVRVVPPVSPLLALLVDGVVVIEVEVEEKEAQEKGKEGPRARPVPVLIIRRSLPFLCRREPGGESASPRDPRTIRDPKKSGFSVTPIQRIPGKREVVNP